MMRSPITSHVLDLAAGRPAARVPVVLEHQEPGGAWREIGRGETDDDGRVNGLLPGESRLAAGQYRITFHTASYLGATGRQGFYPYVPVVFEVSDPEQHYHVPLLLAPHGYSTYRGS
jgi:5-hydroxyisourate hydrolase